eukprot:2043864-Amphidinium_carterae.2
MFESVAHVLDGQSQSRAHFRPQHRLLGRPPSRQQALQRQLISILLTTTSRCVGLQQKAQSVNVVKCRRGSSTWSETKKSEMGAFKQKTEESWWNADTAKGLGGNAAASRQGFYE